MSPCTCLSDFGSYDSVLQKAYVCIDFESMMTFHRSCKECRRNKSFLDSILHMVTGGRLHTGTGGRVHTVTEEDNHR